MTYNKAKVKIVSNTVRYIFENEINDMIEDYEVLDIKYYPIIDGDLITYTALVAYRDS